MKISYRTHPALELLKGNIKELQVCKEDIDYFYENGEVFLCLFKESIPKFSEILLFISAPFFDAAEKSFSKFYDINIDFSTSGTIIYFEEIFFFDIKYLGQNNLEIIFFLFSKRGYPICYHFQKNNKVFNWYTNNWVYTFPKDTTFFLNTIILLLLFKKYAQVETKFLPPNKRVKDINCKYVNDTSLGITHLDSKWFTNLVKSDAFKVRGHFRLQPKKKDGEWTKELIWINDFEKNGYTAKARILL